MSNKTSDENVGNDSVIAHKFATMQQQIDKKDKRIKELEHLNISFEKGIKRLKKKIKEVEGVNKEEVAKMIAERLQKDYIPKQVVIDKIKKLKLSGGSDEKDNVENLVRELTIDILQELLEGEK